MSDPSARPAITGRATILLARHGDAEYGAHGVLSDEGGWLTDKGVQQCRTLAETLLGAGTPIAAVYSSTVERAVESAEVTASALGMTSTAVAGLQEFAVGDFIGRPYGDPDVQAVLDDWYDGKLSASCPEAEDGYALVERFSRALDAIAAAHPNETVLAFSHGGVMSVVVPRIASNTPNDLARDRFVPNAVPAVLSVDRDRWTVQSWPGTADSKSV